MSRGQGRGPRHTVSRAATLASPPGKDGGDDRAPGRFVAIPDSRTGAACVWRLTVGALTPTYPTRSAVGKPVKSSHTNAPIRSYIKRAGKHPSPNNSVRGTLFLTGMAAQARWQQLVNLLRLKRSMSVLEPFTCLLVRPVARPWCFCVYFGLLLNEQVAASADFSNFKVIKIREQ